jgi:predicted dehydrogenase
MRDAEKKSKGKIFVGYQRRYAQAFLDAVEEVGGLGKIQYARVRDIIGPNSTFVAQSATFPKKFGDFRKEDEEAMGAVQEDQVQQALENEFGVEVTRSSKDFLVLLGG